MDVAVNGAAVATLDRGDGPGAPLLCVHGFTGSKEDFEPVLDALAAERRVVAVDLPGHGGTPGPDDPAAYGLEMAAGGSCGRPTRWGWGSVICSGTRWAG